MPTFKQNSRIQVRKSTQNLGTRATKQKNSSKCYTKLR